MFLSEHADIADRLRDCLEALELIESVSGSLSLEKSSEGARSPVAPGDILGDFRILHEVGRGGMGVVYAAEQIDLAGRRVALKVLLTAALLDERALQRFRVETQAAACLNHPNIVPVFAVGCQRGTPCYAMP
jgi:serine/threonine protein kinase